MAMSMRTNSTNLATSTKMAPRITNYRAYVHLEDTGRVRGSGGAAEKRKSEKLRAGATPRRSVESVRKNIDDVLRIIEREKRRPLKRVKLGGPEANCRIAPWAGYHVECNLAGDRLYFRHPDIHGLDVH